MARIDVSEVKFAAASESEQETGLIGYLSFTIGHAFHLDGITVRRTNEGQLTLSYPARRDRRGHDHPHMRPRDTSTRIDIERQVFAALQGIAPRREES